MTGKTWTHNTGYKVVQVGYYPPWEWDWSKDRWTLEPTYSIEHQADAEKLFRTALKTADQWVDGSIALRGEKQNSTS